MNLNEVKKHVIFQFIFYILIGICFLLSLIAILTTNVSASELRSTNVTNAIRNTSNCGTQSFGSYCWGQGSNVTIWEKGNVNTSYGYAVDSLAIDINSFSWNTNSPTTIEIYNAANSFTSNISYSCFFAGNNQPVNCTVERVNNGRININFKTGLGFPEVVYINLGGYLQNIDGININKVMLLQTVDDPNANVIENANQNTSDIINNANSNTTEIVANQNSNTESTNNMIYNTTHQLFESLNNMCPNILNSYDIDTTFRGIRFKANANNIGTVQSYTVTGNLGSNQNAYADIWIGEFKQGMKVKVFWEDCGNAKVYPQIFYVADGVASVLGFANTEYTIQRNFPEGHIALFVDRSNGTSYSCKVSVSLSYTSLNNYCAYGSSTSSKLDGIQGAIQGGLSDVNDTMQDVKDVQQDTYDYMTDDTNPTVPSSDINNILDSVEVDDPLNYLLTLPISLLQKLNTVLSANSCSRVSFGSLYNTELYLPCINFENILGSTIWGTIDLIVGVGLLAIILKRFYDSISNILTMGKEKEVRDKLDLPTPMQFLASILGGGRD